MSTDRLTWLVLDRLIPTDEEAYARAALIARDPELQSLVDQGIITADQAIATLRAREDRYRDPDDSVIWMRQPLAAGLTLLFLAFLAVALIAS
jgi:hypothetical protein